MSSRRRWQYRTSDKLPWRPYNNPDRPPELDRSEGFQKRIHPDDSGQLIKGFLGQTQTLLPGEFLTVGCHRWLVDG